MNYHGTYVKRGYYFTFTWFHVCGIFPLISIIFFSFKNGNKRRQKVLLKCYGHQPVLLSWFSHAHTLTHTHNQHGQLCRPTRQPAIIIFITAVAICLKLNFTQKGFSWHWQRSDSTKTRSRSRLKGPGSHWNWQTKCYGHQHLIVLEPIIMHTHKENQHVWLCRPTRQPAEKYIYCWCHLLEAPPERASAHTDDIPIQPRLVYL